MLFHVFGETQTSVKSSLTTHLQRLLLAIFVRRQYHIIYHRPYVAHISRNYLFRITESLYLLTSISPFTPPLLLHTWQPKVNEWMVQRCGVAGTVCSTYDPCHFTKANCITASYLEETVVFSLYKLRNNIYSGLLLGLFFKLQVERPVSFFNLCMCFLKLNND